LNPAWWNSTTSTSPTGGGNGTSANAPDAMPRQPSSPRHSAEK